LLYHLFIAMQNIALRLPHFAILDKKYDVIQSTEMWQAGITSCLWQ